MLLSPIEKIINFSKISAKWHKRVFRNDSTNNLNLKNNYIQEGEYRQGECFLLIRGMRLIFSENLNFNNPFNESSAKL